VISALTDFGRRVPKLIVDNSPAILTAIGVTGALTTAYLTGRATFKAADLIFEAQLERGYEEPLELKEKVQLCWKAYIPAAASAVLTVAAIVTSNRVGARRAAALASAFAITEKAFDEYRAKVVEKLGEKKEEAVRAEIAQDRINKSPIGDREVIVTGNGSVLCFDGYSGRYFLSDMETIRKAENDINWQVIHDMYASLSDLYELLGLAPTTVSDEVGWNVDKQLTIKVTSGVTEVLPQKPFLFLDYTTTPIRGYNRLQ
jgi:hypothetical protein